MGGERCRNLLSQLGKEEREESGWESHSCRLPDPEEGMHDESEAVNMSWEMSAGWFPCKETPAGAEKHTGVGRGLTAGKGGDSWQEAGRRAQ